MHRVRKVRNLNNSGKGFFWIIAALVVIAAVVIGFASRPPSTNHEIENVSFDITIINGAIQLKAATANKNIPIAELYEDFSCPHCSPLAEATDQDMKSAIEAGNLIVNIRNLNFLDRGMVGHSTNAGTAAYAVAQLDSASVFWNFRAALMAEQERVYGSSKEEIAQLAASLGAEETTVRAIATGVFKAEYLAFARRNEDKLKADTGTISSPRVIINTNEVAADELSDWVQPYL